MNKASINVKKNFLTGLIFVLPVGVSIWILAKIFFFLDSILGKTLYTLIGKEIPGLGLLVTVIFIWAAGYFSNRFIGKKTTELIHTLFEKLPIINVIYKPLRNVMSKFSNESSSNFKQVVLVNFPNSEGKSIGFITNDNIVLDDNDKIFVFVPTTPNPTNGFLMLYDRGDVVFLDIPVEQGLSMVVSLGSSFEGSLSTQTEKN